jgi:hypothetical protein
VIAVDCGRGVNAHVIAVDCGRGVNAHVIAVDWPLIGLLVDLIGLRVDLIGLQWPPSSGHLGRTSDDLLSGL